MAAAPPIIVMSQVPSLNHLIGAKDTRISVLACSETISALPRARELGAGLGQGQPKRSSGHFENRASEFNTSIFDS